MTATIALRAEGLAKAFGATTAVDGVGLEVAPGSLVGLVGANGAGKTTLLRLLLGLLAPDAGTVGLLGGPPTRERRQRVGYVAQGLGLWGDLTLSEHFQLVGDLYDRPVLEPADAALRAVGDRLVGGLPLGLQRRAACAVALAHAPELLVLDEPTSGMDPLGRRRLWDLLRATAAEGTAVLVTTHHLAEAEQCDEVILLAGGQVVAAGAPSELVRDVTVVEVAAEGWDRAWIVLDEAGLAVLPAGRALRVTGTDPATVERHLAAAGVPAEVRSVPASLEELFLAVTGP